jgi:CheY-like chemotaxis protein
MSILSAPLLCKKMHDHARPGNCPNGVLEALGWSICRLTYATRSDAVNDLCVMDCTAMQNPRPLILLLEDDDASAEAMQIVLHDWGADVVHGADAENVASAAGSRASTARVIITDFHLPVADGVTAAKQLRKRAPGARVLVLSGSLNNDARRAAKGAGYAFMPKPAPKRDIIAWLERTYTTAE